MPTKGKRHHKPLYLGHNDLGELRLEALNALASEAGFCRDGEPSIAAWIRHLADQRIQEDGTGYVGVVSDDGDGKRIIFLTRVPETGADGKLLVETAPGVEETCEHAECTGVLGTSGARRLLHAHRVLIPDNVDIVRNVWYLAGGSKEVEAHNRAHAYAHGLRSTRPDSGTGGVHSRTRGRALVHCRLGELLLEKEVRDGRRYTVNEVSAATGVESRTVRVYIDDKVQVFSGRALEAFCDFLGCELSDLLALAEGDQ